MTSGHWDGGTSSSSRSSAPGRVAPQKGGGSRSTGWRRVQTSRARSMQSRNAALNCWRRMTGPIQSEQIMECKHPYWCHPAISMLDLQLMAPSYSYLGMISPSLQRRMATRLGPTVICQNLIYLSNVRTLCSMGLNDILLEYIEIEWIHEENLLTGQLFRAYNR